MITGSRPATTDHHEYPVTFAAGREELFGIFTESRSGRSDVAVVLLTGAGHMPMTDRNRLGVRLASLLAGEGFPVLRFDYHGVGESTGEISAYWLDRPFVEDLECAVRWLRNRHVSKIVLIGSCFGARTILAFADRCPELRTAVLLSPPVRGYEYQVGRSAGEFTFTKYLRKAARLRVLRKVRDAGWREAYLTLVKGRVASVVRRMTRPPGPEPGDDLRWVSRRFLDPLRQLVRRRVPVLILYGSQDSYYPDFQKALRGDLGDVVREGQDTLEIRAVDGVLHGFSTLESQQAVVDLIGEWVGHSSTGLGDARFGGGR